MRKFFVVSMMLTLVLALTPLARAEDDLDAIAARLEKAAAEVKSYTADVRIEMSAPGSEEVMMTTTGRLEQKRKSADDVMFRMDQTMKMEMMGQSMEQKILTVSDGEDIWTEMDIMGQKMAMKVPEDQQDLNLSLRETDLVEQLRKMGEVTVLPEETIDGADVYVFEVKPDETGALAQGMGPGMPGMGLMRFYIAKDTAIPLKTLMLTEEDAIPFISTTYSNIQLNPEIPDDRFEYTPGPGVQVVDPNMLGGMMGGM